MSSPVTKLTHQTINANVINILLLFLKYRLAGAVFHDFVEYTNYDFA